jgi:hypothetical protein
MLFRGEETSSRKPGDLPVLFGLALVKKIPLDLPSNGRESSAWRVLGPELPELNWLWTDVHPLKKCAIGS